MAKITTSTRLSVETTFVLDERDVRVLDAIFGYGGEALVETVQKHLGKGCLDRVGPQNAIALVETMRQDVARAIAQIDKARKTVAGPPDAR
jgi:hypothetical protein